MPYPMMDYYAFGNASLEPAKEPAPHGQVGLAAGGRRSPAAGAAAGGPGRSIGRADRGRPGERRVGDDGLWGAPVKNGAGPLVNALVEGGFITHLATQGAGVIHDWEFAFQGASGESVRENAPAGRFGSWEETGRWINLAVLCGAAEGIGFGEAVGRMIVENGLTIPAADALRHSLQERPDDDLAARGPICCG